MFVVAMAWGSTAHEGTPRDAVERLIDTLVTAVPIGGPTVGICANAACVYKLKKKGITVLNPAKLRPAAGVSIVCFDKTGTLTGSVVSAAAVPETVSVNPKPLHNKAARSWDQKKKSLCGSFCQPTRLITCARYGNCVQIFMNTHRFGCSKNVSDDINMHIMHAQPMPWSHDLSGRDPEAVLLPDCYVLLPELHSTLLMDNA